MTHRLFSRNAASSRAIPVAKAIELIKADTAKPIHWGKNQPGMSAKEECNAVMASHSECHGYSREEWWDEARDAAIYHAEEFNAAGYHKQIVNRMLEPFSHIKVVCTATEYDNFFYLRCHPDAQPEIQKLAELMYDAREASVPVKLLPGSWHTPYFKNGQWIPTSYSDAYGEMNDDGATLEDALAISASCCAQVSYRVLNDSLEKAKDIYKRLVESKPVHASPFEHQATPMKESRFREDDQVLLYVQEGTDADTLGITHFDRRGHAWSGNLKGWVQHRQLIDGNVCNHYKP
jgi:thymidylate synthase ThyX